MSGLFLHSRSYMVSSACMIVHAPAVVHVETMYVPSYERTSE